MSLQKFERSQVIQAGEILTHNETHIRIRQPKGFIDVSRDKFTNLDTCGEPVTQYAVREDGLYTVWSIADFFKMHTKMDADRAAREIEKCLDVAFILTANKFGITAETFHTTFMETFHPTNFINVYMGKDPLNFKSSVIDGKYTVSYELDGDTHHKVFTPHRDSKVAWWAEELVHRMTKTAEILGE